MKKRMSVSEAARIMGRAGRGDCKRRNVDYRRLARMAVAARRKKALMKGVDKHHGVERGTARTARGDGG